MGLVYQNLSPEIRHYMTSELAARGSSDTLALHRGDLILCVEDLRLAAKLYNDDWLAERLLEEAVTTDRERQQQAGKGYWRFVNISYAARQIAETEFNKLYILGVCQHAILSGLHEVEIYCAKRTRACLSEVDAFIGRTVEPKTLIKLLRGDKCAVPYNGLREADFTDTGLSVRIPAQYHA